MTSLAAHEVGYRYDVSWHLGPISLQVESGQVLAVVGPNGAGKTTLMCLLARLLRPTAGRVNLDGRSIWSMPPGELARRLAFAPQRESTILPLTVEESVALGRAAHRGWLLPLSRHDRRCVDAALSRLELTSLRRRSTATLSGGEQRRVVIARALAQEPQILLLDEPTAHLDLRHVTELLGLVVELAHDQGLGVIMTLHDLNEAARWADQVALVSGGRLAAFGPPAKILTADRIHQVYRVAVDVRSDPLHGKPWITPRQPGQERGAGEGVEL